jgi:hypothetical protein
MQTRMVSQAPMRRFFASSFGWLGLAAGLVFISCGQSEGERCQVDSDCKGGLKCDQGSTGNGRCRSKSYTGPDAALKQDASKDLLSPLSPETETDTGSEPGHDGSTDNGAAVDASVDVAVDGPIGAPDSRVVDAATDSPRPDFPKRDTNIDAPASPEVGVDAGAAPDTAPVDADQIDL